MPERGLDSYAVGIDRELAEIRRQLDLTAKGGGYVKFLRGGYGCGKTFMGRVSVLEAQKQGFATSFVVVSDNDLKFHRFDDVYRKVVSALGTASCPRGALSDILDRWIGRIEDGLINTGADPDAADFDGKVAAKLAEELTSMVGNHAPAEFVRAVQKIFELKQAGNPGEAASLRSWLSGSTNVAASAKKVADIRGEIGSRDAMAHLRGIVGMVHAAGYKGLILQSETKRQPERTDMVVCSHPNSTYDWHLHTFGFPQTLQVIENPRCLRTCTTGLSCSRSAGRCSLGPGGSFGSARYKRKNTELNAGLMCRSNPSTPLGRLGYANTANVGDDEHPSRVGNVMIGGPVAKLASCGAHNCIISGVGTVRCWGRGELGQLGYGDPQHIGDNEVPSTAGDVSVIPITLGPFTKVTQVSVGTAHTCAVFDTGEGLCWGDGNTAALGDDEFPSSARPLEFPDTIASTTAGAAHSCALLEHGDVYCWGNNGLGQLGYGTTDNIGDDEPADSGGLIDLGGPTVQVAAGFFHTCALTENNEVRCWGINDGGQLGLGRVRAHRQGR